MDEKAMVESVLAGDARAQEAFDSAFRRRLYATAVHFLGPGDAEAEDVVQETFAVAHRKLADFEFRSGLYLWLNHICVNFCLKRLHRRYRTLVAQEEDLEVLTQAPALDQARRREELDDAHGLATAARRALQKLSGGCRRMLELRHLEDRSYVELGRLLKIPLGTVMSRLARCRERWKTAMRELGAMP